MDFAFDARTEQLRAELLDFMVSQVHPAEPVFAEQLAASDNRWAWSTVPVLGEPRKWARSRGLWNLFLPGEHVDVDAPEPLDGGADTCRYRLAASDLGGHADSVPELRRDLIG